MCHICVCHNCHVFVTPGRPLHHAEHYFMSHMIMSQDKCDYIKYTYLYAYVMYIYMSQLSHICNTWSSIASCSALYVTYDHVTYDLIKYTCQITQLSQYTIPGRPLRHAEHLLDGRLGTGAGCTAPVRK